jgi:VanZ family protein
LKFPLNNRKNIAFWLDAWLPVALAIGVIVMESTEAFGADRTSGPLRWLYESILGAVSSGRWDMIHALIRKSGHIVGYGLIGLAWLRAWRMVLSRFSFIQDALLALLGTALIASADEFHQTFLPNRTGTPWDVLLDCSSAFVLQFVVYFMLHRPVGEELSRAA